MTDYYADSGLTHEASQTTDLWNGLRSHTHNKEGGSITIPRPLNGTGLHLAFPKRLIFSSSLSTECDTTGDVGQPPTVDRDLPPHQGKTLQVELAEERFRSILTLACGSVW